MSTVSLQHEYEAATQACGLLDRSERGKLRLTGPEAKDFLNGQVTNDVLELTPGTGCYAAFLTPKGKMRGDMRVLDLGDELFLDCERVALQDLFDLIRHYKLGRKVELHKATIEYSLFSLIGPTSETHLPSDPQLGTDEHSNAPAVIGSSKVILVRTDLGVDVICESGDAEAVASVLVDSGAEVIALRTAEVLRVERGRPRFGVDLNDTVIPQEAALNDRAVSFTKGCYVGQETVARLFYRGKPNRHLRGLRLTDLVPSGSELLVGEKVVGKIGSVALSPRLGPIGLALVRKEVNIGDVVKIAPNGATAQVTELPF